MGQLSQYEAEINGSPVFRIDRERDPSVYEREKNHFISIIYQYKLQENPANEEFGLEIFETARDCLAYYSIEKGEFLPYFNTSFSRAKEKAAAREGLLERSSGIHFSESAIASSRAIYEYLQKHPGVSVEELHGRASVLAPAFGMTAKEFSKALTVYVASITHSGDAAAPDTEGVSLFDTLASGLDITKREESRAVIQQMADVCETCYGRARQGSQRFLAMKLTSGFADHDTDGSIYPIICRKAFFLKDVYIVVTERGRGLTTRAISRILSKSESSLTQTWKTFQKHLLTEFYQHTQQ